MIITLLMKFIHNMIERSHLTIIQALAINGTLTEAANALCLSQSALSHQIRYLEKKLEVKLWERQGRNLRLTQAGELLLQTAQQILPVLQQAEQTLKAYGEGRQGILRIGVECYPCYRWLTTVIGVFLEQMPDVDIDIINKFQFSGLEGLRNHHIDILVTPDKVAMKGVHYDEIAEYELVLMVAETHRLATRKHLLAKDLADETLLVFPVAPDRLDVLTHFLNPAGIRPDCIRNIESVELMAQMVALQRGVCVFPEWLADSYAETLSVKNIRLGRGGMHRNLYVALRNSDETIPYITQFRSIAAAISQ